MRRPRPKPSVVKSGKGLGLAWSELRPMLAAVAGITGAAADVSGVEVAKAVAMVTPKEDETETGAKYIQHYVLS